MFDVEMTITRAEDVLKERLRDNVGERLGYTYEEVHEQPDTMAHVDRVAGMLRGRFDRETLEQYLDVYDFMLGDLDK